MAMKYHLLVLLFTKKLLTHFKTDYTLNFYLTEGEICFPLATDVNTQVHLKKENNHYMKSQPQLLGNANSKELVFHWLSQVTSLILRWKDYNQFRFFSCCCLFFHRNSPTPSFYISKITGQYNNLCRTNWTIIQGIISYFLLEIRNN